MLPVPLPTIPGSNWHAQQLKQLAASKQVSTTKQQVQAPSWPSMSPPGLSPPYRAGSSPHHQPFSPQNVMVSGMPANNLPGNNIQSPQNTLQSKNMNIIMQQPSASLQPGLVNESPVNQDQFSFNNTKPLSHFASESATQKMSPLTAGQGQQSLIHYLQQQQQQSPAAQQSQQANNSQFLQQQFRQLMQPHRMQRHMQSATLPSQNRQVSVLLLSCWAYMQMLSYLKCTLIPSCAVTSSPVENVVLLGKTHFSLLK
uniref:Mastermind like domain containing 1 n=1 Tax=Meleagris gallopavo TaxID=9103 RepID=A0A803Y8R0_MELGA